MIQHTLADRLILALDRAWRPSRDASRPPRPYPAEDLGPDALAGRERRHVAGLMRVNHAGEIAAQGLYEGQAAMARSPRVRAALEAAAREEADHLAWCRRRLAELDAGPSRLDPLWHAGSLAVGMIAAATGDRASLGFVAETERQVVAHLGCHLDRLPRRDERTRAILAQMAADERRHGERAAAAGGGGLPGIARAAMRLSATVMTRTAYWV